MPVPIYKVSQFTLKGRRRPLLFAYVAKIDLLADHNWNKDDPRWLGATVWAAQYTAWEWLQSDKPCPGPKRCAACAAQIADTKPKTRCSKCLLVRLDTFVCELASLLFAEVRVHAGVFLQ